MNLSQGPQFMLPNSWSGPVAPARLSSAGAQRCAYPMPPPSAEYCSPASFSREVGGDRYARLSTAYGASTKRTQ